MKTLLVTELNGAKRLLSISFWNYFKLKSSLFGTVFLEYRLEKGWTARHPIYVSCCKKHGYYLAKPCGYYDLLFCHDCLIEIDLERERKLVG